MEHIQINLDNDTADFRARTSALALNQLDRPKGTHRAYDAKIKEWKVRKLNTRHYVADFDLLQAFCESHRYDDGMTVHEAKVVRFMQEEVISRPLKTSRKANADLDSDEEMEDAADDDAPAPIKSTLKYNSVRGYKTALVDLWSYQLSRHQNSHPHPNGSALRSLMKSVQKSQHTKRKLAFEDRGRGTVADGYNEAGLKDIVNEFWRQSIEGKGSAVGCYLRGLLNYLMGHHLLARGESRRFAELPDLLLLELQNEGPKPCPALLYIMSNGKTNQNGRIEYCGLLRHKDVMLCGMNALAVYLFWRWEQSGEAFPSFKSNADWYSTRLLLGKLFSALSR